MNPCTLQARWTGPLPEVGDFLLGSRPRWAYRIIEVIRLKALPHHLPGITRAKFVCVRYDPTDSALSAEDVRIHLWKWNARKKVAEPATTDLAKRLRKSDT